MGKSVLTDSNQHRYVEDDCLPTTSRQTLISNEEVNTRK